MGLDGAPLEVRCGGGGWRSADRARRTHGIDAGCTAYPEHDHIKDGQEECYLVLKGSATLQLASESAAVDEGMVVRVGPGEKRKFLPGPDGVVLLAIGATPGRAFVPRR